VASRPSSTSGSARAGTPEPEVARVIVFAPREHAIAAANDNRRPSAHTAFGAVGTALAVALAVGLYLYLS
jgi:hypothetical protein